MPGLNYIYRFRKIKAEIENTVVEAVLHKITSTCQSPMDIDPRKGAVIFFRSDRFSTDHPELLLKPENYSSLQEWIEVLKKDGTAVLPVSILKREENGETKLRFVVSGSIPSYQAEIVEHVALWFPTKAYKTELMCDKGNGNPETVQEKLDFRIRRVNHFLTRYAEWANGENYSLTLMVMDKKTGKQERLVENMFLGTGYEYCSEIARSYISLTVRQRQGRSLFNPETADDNPS
jgi:hypothetical protein